MDALNKQTNFPGGISTGGGDTGSDVVSMPMRIGTICNANNHGKDNIRIPANTLVYGAGVIPFKTAGNRTAPTVGQAEITADGTPGKYLAARDAFALYQGDSATIEVVDVDTLVDIGVSPDIDGDVYVYLEVMPLESNP